MKNISSLMKNKYIWFIIAALIIKFGLFSYMVVFSPQGKFQPDSGDYLKSAEMIATRGAFALDVDGKLNFELFRTPGFPFFLAIFHYLLKIPLEGVIFLQILLAISVAFITYKAAYEINQKTAFLSAMIVLYSPPITIYSLQVLADTLFLFLISLFLLVFIRYLKSRAVKWLLLSAVFLALATYVRPVSYYFCLAVAIFIVYANIRDKSWWKIFHAPVFLLIAYSLLGIWLVRNHIHFQRYIFTNIQSDYRAFPVFEYYAKNDYFLGKTVAPIFSYINTAWNCFLSLMTRPGSLKYLHSYPLTVIGKILGYPFVVFWWIGLLAGLVRIGKNIYYQFILFMMAYFISITIAVIARSSGERYLIPIIPLIAIISANGWVKLREIYLRRKRIHPLQHL